MTQMVAAPATAARAKVRPIHWPLLLGSSILVWVAPRTMGKVWLRGSPGASMVAALVNVGAGLMILAHYIRPPFLTAKDYQWVLAGAGVGMVAFVIMLGFAILPFVAMPGPSGPVMRHMTRAMCLGTTMVYVWTAWLLAADRLLPHILVMPDIYDKTYYWMATGAGLLAFSYVVLARAAAVDYGGGPAAAREPRCDDCGYDIHTIPLEGRCPECGKPVVDCLGAYVRPPTPWERHPSFFNWRVILRQFGGLVARPQALFRVMPITSGFGAARRWLVLMLGVVFVESFWAVPSIHLLAKDFSPKMNDWPFYAIGLSVATVWTFLAVMMVGIETGGVTLVSRFRRQPIDLANASKVTCYASSLLFLWVILGTVQIDALVWWLSLPGAAARLSDRTGSLFVVVTFGVAHIGGLGWFEWTVYRGLRAVMYAIR